MIYLFVGVFLSSFWKENDLNVLDRRRLLRSIIFKTQSLNALTSLVVVNDLKATVSGIYSFPGGELRVKSFTFC